MTNPYTEKYNKVADSSETVGSKTIDLLSNTILILNENKEHIRNKDHNA